MRRISGPVFGLLLAAFAASSAAADPPDDGGGGLDGLSLKYFQGMRERRLFRLAESQCVQQLARGKLSLHERADLTIELSRTLAEHATYVGPSEQLELFDRARNSLHELLKAEPENPRRVLLEVQDALVVATIGEQARWQAELQPFDEAAREQAAKALGEAAGMLRALDGSLSERLRKGNSPRATPGELRASDVRGLTLTVRQRLAIVLLDLAHVLPGDAAERVNGLAEAQKLLKPLADSAEEEDFIWSSRVALAECLRLSGDAVRAVREIEALTKKSPPADAADRLLAERARALLAQQKVEAAVTLLLDAEQERRELPGELAFLIVQAQTEQWRAQRQAEGVSAARELLAALEQRVERMQRDIGGFWSYRAELVLAQARDVETYGPELAALVRRAQSAFGQGRAEEAADLYRQASAAAGKSGRDEFAFQFGFTRGSIETRLKHWQTAADDLLALAERFPRHPKAAEAHLLATFALGRLFDEKPTKTNRERYTEALEAHRSRFVQSTTVPEATWMLAALNERRGQFTVALGLYREVPWEHKRAPAAQAAIARCYERILERLREIGDPVDAWERDAVAELSKLLPSGAEAQAAYDPAQGEVAVRLARILLRRQPPDYAAADRLLARASIALAGPSKAAAQSSDAAGKEADPVAELRAQGGQLRIISLAGQSRFHEARELLERLSTAGPAELLRILEGLAPLVADDRQDPYHDLGELQLQAALRLNDHREKLSPAQQRRLDECLASGYAATGQTRRAAESYAELLKQTPRDRALLKSHAETLVKLGDRAALRDAVTGWRKLEALLPAGSDEWLAIRLEECRTLFALKSNDEACKLLKVTRALYPKLGGEKLAEQFAELEKKCRGPK